MKEQQTIIDEATLAEDLEPSEEFAGLVARVGNQAGVGNLSLGAVRKIVRDRATAADGRTTKSSSRP